MSRPSSSPTTPPRRKRISPSRHYRKVFKLFPVRQKKCRWFTHTALFLFSSLSVIPLQLPFCPSFCFPVPSSVPFLLFSPFHNPHSFHLSLLLTTLHALLLPIVPFCFPCPSLLIDPFLRFSQDSPFSGQFPFPPRPFLYGIWDPFAPSVSLRVHGLDPQRHFGAFLSLRVQKMDPRRHWGTGK